MTKTKIKITDTKQTSCTQKPRWAEFLQLQCPKSWACQQKRKKTSAVLSRVQPRESERGRGRKRGRKFLNWWEKTKKAHVTHLSDCNKLSSTAESKIRSKETETEFTKASACMFRSQRNLQCNAFRNFFFSRQRQRGSGLAQTGSVSSEANRTLHTSAFD